MTMNASCTDPSGNAMPCPLGLGLYALGGLVMGGFLVLIGVVFLFGSLIHRVF